MISAFSCNTFSSSLFRAQSWCSLSSSIYYQKWHLSTYIYMYLLSPLLLLWCRLGWGLILPKKVKSMHISFILETFKYKWFLSHQFTKFSVCMWHIASSSLLIFPTSYVSANLTTGHDSSVLLQSAVYSANKKGAKTVPWGAPVFVLIADDSNPFSLTYWSLLVR